LRTRLCVSVVVFTSKRSSLQPPSHRHCPRRRRRRRETTPLRFHPRSSPNPTESTLDGGVYVCKNCRDFCVRYERRTCSFLRSVRNIVVVVVLVVVPHGLRPPPPPPPPTPRGRQGNPQRATLGGRRRSSSVARRALDARDPGRKSARRGPPGLRPAGPAMAPRHDSFLTSIAAAPKGPPTGCQARRVRESAVGVRDDPRRARPSSSRRGLVILFIIFLRKSSIVRPRRAAELVLSRDG
jgi:hypothetical protein